MKRVHTSVSQRALNVVTLGVVAAGGAWLLSGCVVLEEKYNAEKARSLNFQRLLAQEEKRTAELDSEVKRTKKELTEFEARNRELSAQVQSAREQMARLQEETEAIKESALLERKAMEDMRKTARAPVRPKPQDLHAEIVPEEVKAPADVPKEPPAPPAPPVVAKAGPTIHVVKPGETLFRIGRRYGVELDKLRKWNKLQDDIIEVGQKLIVGTE